MELEQLRNHIINLRASCATMNFFAGIDYAKIADLVEIASKALPEHDGFFKRFKKQFLMNFPYDVIQPSIVEGFCDYVIELIDAERMAGQKEKEGKLFLSADDKIVQAGKAFRREDRTGVFNELNTAVELMLKKKLGIPITIKKINNAKILDVLIAEGIGPGDFLKAVRKCLCLTGDVKHRAFNPTEQQCVLALASVEELRRELEKAPIGLPEKVKEKIFTREYLVENVAPF
jgi:hypothetical protein